MANGGRTALRCGLPYRIDLNSPPADALDRLIEWGALDVEEVSGGLAAILPDFVTPEAVAAEFGSSSIRVSAARAHDNDSVWLLSPRAVRAAGLLITPAGAASSPEALQLTDSNTFGTGHHPTTALCLEAIEEIVRTEHPASVLDVGTGSGILALAALRMGVPRAVGIDTDASALEAASENARLNRLSDRVEFILGGPGAVKGNWQVIVANVSAAPLIEMAPALVQRLASRGRLILSGIQVSLELDVRRAYQHLGVGRIDSRTRNGWTALMIDAPY